jgi:hypothetical protein
VPTITIKAFQAEHTYSDLLALVARISNDLPVLRMEGIAVAGVGIADQQNRVILDLVRDEASWIAYLRRQYGADFVVFRHWPVLRSSRGGRFVAAVAAIASTRRVKSSGAAPAEMPTNPGSTGVRPMEAEGLLYRPAWPDPSKA